MQDFMNFLRQYPDIVRLIGVAGFFVYIIGFFLVQVRLVCGNSNLFALSQIVAALMVLVSLSTDFNLASFLIQICYAAIGSLGIMLRIKRMMRKTKQPLTQLAV